MCGIFCHISQNCEDNEKLSDEWEACKHFINARGPDKIDEQSKILHSNWHGHFAASVLWMQGPEPMSQPAVDSSGNILLWNGDIFSGTLAEDKICDTHIILNAFQSSSNILVQLQKIQGPYSFVYFQQSTNLLYFGRDFIGRHSLLLALNTDEDKLTLTSVASKKIKGVIEVPAIGIFVINLNHPRLNLSCYPWKDPDLRFTDIIEKLESHLDVDLNIRGTILLPELPLTDLHLHPDVKDLEYLESVGQSENYYEVLKILLENDIIKRRINHLSALLHKAVEIRIQKMPKLCTNCIKVVLKTQKNIVCDHAKVGVLFSGGLDSTILALIANQYVPQQECIDLINVAFEKMTSIMNNCTAPNETINSSHHYDVPDRKTGKQSLLELSNLCPKRKWNFVQVNVSQSELQKYRSSRICELLYPLCTILDESLGCAVWFASRGKGFTSSDVYESPCRILLLGMGADELFGGYMRHRTTLKHKGWDALGHELNVELARISERNLGRDDRIVSDHGRQSRLPYLDENIVEYVQQLKPWERCYPTEQMPSGLGDKLLLRLLAYKLGLQSTATLPKRAFQFGSRIANSKENAKDVSNRL